MNYRQRDMKQKENNINRNIARRFLIPKID